MMAEKMCYRCSFCSIHWPLSSQYAQCPLCEEECSPLQAEAISVLSHDAAKGLLKTMTEEPPHKNMGLAKGEVGGSEGKSPEHHSIHRSEIFEWRYGAFMRMGFGPAEAEALANTWLDTYRVKKMLDQGCKAETVLAILL